MRRAKHLTIVARVPRCAFCGREVNDQAVARRENPFCSQCLAVRLAAASERLGPIDARIAGEYVEFFSADSRTPR